MVVGVLARVYFDLSYQLLAGSAAGRRLLEWAAAGGEPVHGYFTIEDRDELQSALAPRPGERLLDLGCGVGGIALEVHRRTGAQVLGVDVSSRAVAAATRRAARAGVGTSVRFVAGDLARPPRVGARNAYAVDSLMFVPDLEGTLRGIGNALGPGGRLFATLLIVGSGGSDGPDRLDEVRRAQGMSVERIDNVSAALGERSRARSTIARILFRDRATSRRGRLAMLLVVAEEAFVQALLARNLVTRWRIVVSFPGSHSAGPGWSGEPWAANASLSSWRSCA